MGVITGYYLDSSLVTHGFVRIETGVITSFDAPGATYTSGNAINTAGTITGIYDDANFVTHGFVRSATGAITSFDAPGSSPMACGLNCGVPTGTIALAINSAGVITGYYPDQKGGQGFVRSETGVITTFDVPGDDTPVGHFTFPQAINTAGVITGYYLPSQVTASCAAKPA